MHSLVSEGVVLSTKTYGEADKIITVFSREFGKLSVMAKGVKRPKSRKRGSLEIFSIIKFIAHRGHGMPIITEVEILDNLADLRTHLNKVSVAYFFAEVIARTTRDEEQHTEIYSALVYYLKKLNAGDSLKKMRRDFSLEILRTLGFIPEGQFVPDADDLLESVIERKFGSVRVGKKLQE